MNTQHQVATTSPIYSLMLLAQREVQYIQELLNPWMKIKSEMGVSSTQNLVDIPFIRSLLTIASAHLAGNASEPIFKLAAAVEMLNVAIRLHSRIQHLPEKHVSALTSTTNYQQPFNILAGDFLLAGSFRLMFESGSLPALSLLGKASEAIVESEIHELQLFNKSQLPTQTYLKIVGTKTALLFGTACQVAPVVIDTNNDIKLALWTFGYHLGFACQLMDDFRINLPISNLDFMAKQQVMLAKQALSVFDPSKWKSALEELCELTLTTQAWQLQQFELSHFNEIGLSKKNAENSHSWG